MLSEQYKIKIQIKFIYGKLQTSYRSNSLQELTAHANVTGCPITGGVSYRGLFCPWLARLISAYALDLTENIVNIFIYILNILHVSKRGIISNRERPVLGEKITKSFGTIMFIIT